MTDLFEAANTRIPCCNAAARLLVPHLEGDGRLTRVILNKAMAEAYGGTDAEGRWTQRESFEVLEHALALFMRRGQIDAVIDTGIALIDRLPTQTVRSEDQIAWQQFSTPIDIAAVVVKLANATADDIVLEPSAGNGLLVCQLGKVAALQLNEIDPARRARLLDSFPEAVVSGHDGATVASTMAALPRPTLILMNPPFSRSIGRGSDHLAAIRHLAAAIRRLTPGGRIVAVMPDWFAPSGKVREIFENTLSAVSVRTSIRLSDAYGKHGTGVAVRIFVLDKIGSGTVPAILGQANVRELIANLVVPPRSPLVPGTGVPSKRAGGYRCSGR